MRSYSFVKMPFLVIVLTAFSVPHTSYGDCFSLLAAYKNSKKKESKYDFDALVLEVEQYRPKKTATPSVILKAGENPRIPSDMPYGNARTFDEYNQRFSNDLILKKTMRTFQGDLKNLRSDQTYLDLGAGNGTAALGAARYLNDRNEAKWFPTRDVPQITALTYEQSRLVSTNGIISKPEKFKMLSGVLFEQANLRDIGPVDLITDYFGVATYIQDKNWYFAALAAILKPGGRAYIYGARSWNTADHSADTLTLAYDEGSANGRVKRVLGMPNLGRWMEQNATGFKFMSVFSLRSNQIFGNDEVIIIERLEGPVTFPRLKFVDQREEYQHPSIEGYRVDTDYREDEGYHWRPTSPMYEYRATPRDERITIGR